VTNFNRELGMQTAADGSVVLDTRPEHTVGPGFIHFAVVATLAEVSAAQAVGVSVVPASIGLTLISPAKPGRLVARGKLLRKGKRLAVAEGEVTQDDVIVAKALVTFAIMA
jgi:acyl-coenzyme A thioesterase PaaI-like protein